MLLSQSYFGIGIVEDNNDPLRLGRVRVRIYDVHGNDKIKIPTNKLPWAHVLHSANHKSKFETIALGDWVYVTTLDGQNAQEILVLGVLVGYVQKPTTTTTKITPGIQVFDDGSSIQTLDDGSTIITDSDGNLISIEAP
jgi:hypothetical protein